MCQKYYKCDLVCRENSLKQWPLKEYSLVTVVFTNTFNVICI